MYLQYGLEEVYFEWNILFVLFLHVKLAESVCWR